VSSTWDYSGRAATYDQRADYSETALTEVLGLMECTSSQPVADIGAGTGKLTIQLTNRGFNVHSVEPNEEMRHYGMRNLLGHSVRWYTGTGESTTLPSKTFQSVFFGSSFNVVQQDLALSEADRILIPGGWFACMWNHRDLTDALQQGIEQIILAAIPDYDYGSRRTDPTNVIEASGFFGPVEHHWDSFVVPMSRERIIDAWRSHATLQRQAASEFQSILVEIEEFLQASRAEEFIVPYTTRIWIAQKHPR